VSWDEKLFGAFYNFFIKSKSTTSDSSDCLNLEVVRRQSEVFLSALCEKKIEIRDSTSWGGLQENILFLPERMYFINNIEDQLLYLEWRILAASIDIELNGLVREESSFTVIIDRFPHLKANLEKLRIQLKDRPIEAWLGSAPKKFESKASGFDETKELVSRESLSTGTEVKGKTQDRAKRVKVEEREDNPLTHVFEKVLTAEDYQGGQRKMDGRDEMAEQSEALSELNLSQIVRTNQSAQSILKSNAVMDVEGLEYNEDILEKKQKIFYYPEWMERKKSYQDKWCTLFESQAPVGNGPLSYDKKTAEGLRHRVESSFSSYQWQTRQKEGPEIDLNLAIDRYMQMKVGGNIPENIYRKKLKNNHDFAIQILVDSSLSTDSFALGKRIIDTTQEALNIFAAAFDGVLDSISIASFSSFTRNKVHYSIIKEFEDDWSQVPLRIASLKPDGYTRIGPVLRHSRVRLEKQKARKKLLLFISDAKPTDYDHYEGNHGISDIQRAVTELHASGCKVKVLTLTDKKQSHHNFVFGSAHCQVLKNVTELSDSLFNFWFNSVR